MGLLALGAPLGAQSDSSAQNPVVAFTSPGTHQVTLEVCNALGCDTETKPVVVLDPMPAILSMASVPARLLTGQNAALSAQSSGRPPLTHRWRITGTAGSLTLTGNPAIWNTASPGLGALLLQLEVSNVDGSVFSAPVPVSVVPIQIFSDGLESGNASRWQSKSPP
jgi:PKD repeat protein